MERRGRWRKNCLDCRGDPCREKINEKNHAVDVACFKAQRTAWHRHVKREPVRQYKVHQHVTHFETGLYFNLRKKPKVVGAWGKQNALDIKASMG